MKNILIIGAGALASEIDMTFWNNGIVSILSEEKAYSSGEFWIFEESISRFINFIIGIADIKTRIRIAEKYDLSYEVCIDKNVKDEDCCINIGTYIAANSILSCYSVIGKHCIINYNCVIGHDVKIGDYCTIGPSVTICGNVAIGDCVEIGAGATIIPGKKIGQWSKISAGAVVMQDVPEYSNVMGNPGRVIGRNTVGII
jgi:sugar O-acyltransferase (sialic acid O-acetyltransferase NeuD family)